MVADRRRGRLKIRRASNACFRQKRACSQCGGGATAWDQAQQRGRQFMAVKTGQEVQGGREKQQFQTAPAWGWMGSAEAAGLGIS